jgi:RimJ/RimL family protein N-acetyltransferase
MAIYRDIAEGAPPPGIEYYLPLFFDATATLFDYLGTDASLVLHGDIDAALQGQKEGHMLPWAVRDLKTGDIVGSTRYHDIIPATDRVEIGWTWYAARCQRTHVNTACKLLLFEYGFERLGCKVVGLRTDNFNFRSQRAIEALGAKKDGVIRHHWPRRDGSVRDTVMYSVLLAEWPDVKNHLLLRLKRNEAN